MRKLFIFLFISCHYYFLAACQGENSNTPNIQENIAGTYYKSLITKDGQDRNYIVYVPSSVNSREKLALLLVIHGTNQSGQVFYDKGLWNSKADQEGFIVVYPTALTYCHFDEGTQRTTTKWAAGDLGESDLQKGGLPLCVGETLRDDMLFFDELIETLKSEYLVDDKRIYATGFSNGAQMASRLAAERSDIFAAVTIHAGNLSEFIPPTLSPNPMSIIVSVGASDPLFLKKIGFNQPIAINPDAINIPGVKSLINPFLSISGLNSNYTYTERPYFGKKIGRFHFNSSNVNKENSLEFLLIEDLQHNYTSILIDPFWEFLRTKKLQ